MKHGTHQGEETRRKDSMNGSQTSGVRGCWVREDNLDRTGVHDWALTRCVQEIHIFEVAPLLVPKGRLESHQKKHGMCLAEINIDSTQRNGIMGSDQQRH